MQRARKRQNSSKDKYKIKKYLEFVFAHFNILPKIVESLEAQEKLEIINAGFVNIKNIVEG
jgi:hypothetical protein